MVKIHKTFGKGIFFFFLISTMMMIIIIGTVELYISSSLSPSLHLSRLDNISRWTQVRRITLFLSF